MWRDKWSSVQNMLVRRRKTGDVSWKALCHVQPHDVWWVRPLDTCTIRKGAYKHKHHPLAICHELTRTRARTDAHTQDCSYCWDQVSGFRSGTKISNFHNAGSLDCWCWHQLAKYIRGVGRYRNQGILTHPKNYGPRALSAFYILQSFSNFTICLFATKWLRQQVARFLDCQTFYREPELSVLLRVWSWASAVWWNLVFRGVIGLLLPV